MVQQLRNGGKRKSSVLNVQKVLAELFRYEIGSNAMLPNIRYIKTGENNKNVRIV